MTNLLRTRIFLLVILLGSGLGVNAQSWDWRHTFPVSFNLRWLPDTAICDHEEIEVMDIAPASDGKLYSCGLFYGEKAQFGNLSVYADTLLPRKNILNHTSPPTINFQTSYIACQNSNGEYLWVKTLTGSNNYSLNGQYIKAYRTGFYRLCLGPDGSVYATGLSFGDSLNYSGTPIFSKPDPLGGNLKFIVLRAQSSGNLIWAKTYEIEGGFNSSPLAVLPQIFPRHLEYRNNTLELLLNGNANVLFGADSTAWDGPLYVSFSNTGEVLQVRKETGMGVPYNAMYHILTRRLKDKRWVTGYHRGVEGSAISPLGFSGIDVYNPDFSQKLFRVSYKTIGTYLPSVVPVPSHADFHIQQVWELPDGNLGLVLGDFVTGQITPTPSYANLSLIVNSDTLDVSSYFQPGNPAKSLFIKLTQEGCMKQVEPLDYFMMGNGAFSDNGNLIFCRHDTVSHETYTPRKNSLVVLSKNGSEIAQTPLGNDVIWPKPFHFDAYLGYTNFRNFQIRTAPTGNKAWICAGNFVGQFTYPDPALGDESATGCLRGNAITATREIQKQGLFLSQSQNGVEIRATDNQSGRYRILGSDGRLLEEGSWKGSQTPIGRSIGAKGIYQVVLSGSGNHKTLRFVQ